MVKRDFLYLNLLRLDLFSSSIDKEKSACQSGTSIMKKLRE